MDYNYRMFLRTLGKIQIVNHNYYYSRNVDEIIIIDYLMDYNYKNAILFMIIILVNFLFLESMNMIIILIKNSFNFLFLE